MNRILLRGLLGSLLVLVAGLSYARLARPTWYAAFGPLAAWRQDPERFVVGAACGTVGLLLLTWAWWSLVRHVSARSPGDDHTRAGIRAVRLATVVWSLPFLAAPPIFSNDGWSYVASGVLLRHGHSPYVVTPRGLPAPLISGISPVWRDVTSPYGPVPLSWGALAAHVSADPWFLLFAYRLLAIVGVVLLAIAVPRLARTAGLDPARISALAVASPLVLVHGVGGLHNDMLVAGLAAAALAVTTRERWVFGAILAGVAAAVKIPEGLVVVGVVLISVGPRPSLLARVRRTVEVGLVALGTMTAIGFATGLGFGWFTSVLRTANEPAHLAPFPMLGLWLSKAMDLLGTRGHHLVRLTTPVADFRVIGLVAMVALVALVLLRWRVKDKASGQAAGAVVMLVATLCSPAMHYWYFLWCVPLLAAVRLPEPARRAVIALTAALGITAVMDPAWHILGVASLAMALIVGLPAYAAWTAVRDRSRSQDQPPLQATLAS